jgi:hypothetical protein
MPYLLRCPTGPNSIAEKSLVPEKSFHKLKTVKLQPMTVQEDVKNLKPADSHAGGNPYLVLLINTSDLCIVMGRINNGGWFATQTICKNCNTNYDTCYDNHQWGQVMSTGCADAPFNLTLATKPDANGNCSGATWEITPDCRYSGGVIGLQ